MDDEQATEIGNTLIRLFRQHGFICLIMEGQNEDGGLYVSNKTDARVVTNLDFTDNQDLAEWLLETAEAIGASDAYVHLKFRRKFDQ